MTSGPVSYSEPPGARWLRQNWADLLQYNFEWVASDGARLIAHSRELEAVINEVSAQGVQSFAVYALVAYEQVQSS